MDYPQRWLREHNAVVSPEGWRRPITNELLKCQKRIGEDGNGDNSLLGKIIKSINLEPYYPRGNIKDDFTINYNINFDDTILTEEFIESIGGSDFLLNLIIDNIKVTSINNTNYTIVSKSLTQMVLKFDDYGVNDLEEHHIDFILGLHTKRTSLGTFTLYKIPRLYDVKANQGYLIYYTDDILDNTTVHFGVSVYDKDYIPQSITLELEYENTGKIIKTGEFTRYRDTNSYSCEYTFENFVNKTQVTCKFDVDGFKLINDVIITTPPPINI